MANTVATRKDSKPLLPIPEGHPVRLPEEPSQLADRPAPEIENCNSSTAKRKNSNAAAPSRRISIAGLMKRRQSAAATSKPKPTRRVSGWSGDVLLAGPGDKAKPARESPGRRANKRAASYTLGAVCESGEDDEPNKELREPRKRDSLAVTIDEDVNHLIKQQRKQSVASNRRQSIAQSLRRGSIVAEPIRRMSRWVVDKMDSPQQETTVFNSKMNMPLLVDPYFDEHAAEQSTDEEESVRDEEELDEEGRAIALAQAKRGKLLDKMATGGRLVDKRGTSIISHKNIERKMSRYLNDSFNTLVDARWRWIVFIFTIVHFICWFGFAVVYYITAAIRSDLWNEGNEAHKICLNGVYTFTAAFLYSVETQSTIGYGSRYTTEECPEVILLMALQTVLGVGMQTFLVGFVFVKMARPEARKDTLLFSKKAVICMRDGKLCLLFRIADMRKSMMIETHVKLHMIKKRITSEGELLPFHVFDMDVGYSHGLDRIFLVWPITMVHVINEKSPFYEYSANDLKNARFEIIAILDGIIESRGMNTQARTSYLPSEICWGYRFDKLLSYQKDDGHYQIDFQHFDGIQPIDTPTCSAKTLEAMAKSLAIPRALKQAAIAEDGEVTRKTSRINPHPSIDELSQEMAPGSRKVSRLGGGRRNSAAVAAETDGPPDIKTVLGKDPFLMLRQEPDLF